MRLALGITTTLLFTNPLQAAIIVVTETLGELCPSAKDIVVSENEGIATLEVMLGRLPATIANDKTLTARHSCNFNLRVAPGDKREVILSDASLSGRYSFEQSGRVFLSISERTLLGEDQTLNHTVTARHRSEEGTYKFSENLESWAVKRLPCGEPFDLNISLAATARKTTVAGPTLSKLEQFLYRIHTSPCRANSR